MKSRTVVVTWMLSAALPLWGAGPESAQAPAPTAKKVPHMQKLHGDELVDPYYWMRERENPEVRAYLEKENAYAEAFMKPTEALQKTLYDEMLGRIKETDLTVPYRDRGYFYYSRTEKGKQYPIYCRKKGSVEAPEQVILDVNELAKGQRFMSVGARQVTDDGRLLAYTTDNTGFRDYTLRIKDLQTGKLLPETMERVTSVAWAPDNKTLFYATTDHAKRPHKIWRHTLGTDTSADALLYEEKDERFRVGAYRSRSGAYLFFPSSSHTTSEWRYVPAATPAAEMKMVAPRIQEQEYSVDHRGDLFYIMTNDQGRNNRLVTAPAADPVPGELEGGRAASRRRDARRLRSLPRLDGPVRAPGRAAAHPGLERVSRRRLPDRLPGGDLLRRAAEQPRVRHRDAPHRVRVLHDASRGLRLRHGHEGAQAPQAARSARLRSLALHLGAALRDRFRRNEGPDLARLQEGVRRRRHGARAADGLRLLRRLERRRVRLDARQPARPRRRLRRRPHPRRRRPRQEVARRREDAQEEELLHRLHRGRRDARRRQVHLEGPPRHRGRLRRAGCSWARW